MGDDKTGIEQRLQHVEDKLSIYNLIASYGPAVDSLSNRDAAELWTDDGVYAAAKVGVFKGHHEIAGLFGGDLNVDFMKRGGAHVLSFPYVEIDGDTAVATNHATVYLHTGDAHKAVRVVASRWELVRTPAGWRVKRRLNEIFDGSMAARRLIGTRHQADIGPYQVQE